METPTTRCGPSARTASAAATAESMPPDSPTKAVCRPHLPAKSLMPRVSTPPTCPASSGSGATEAPSQVAVSMTSRSSAAKDARARSTPLAS